MKGLEDEYVLTTLGDHLLTLVERNDAAAVDELLEQGALTTEQFFYISNVPNGFGPRMTILGMAINGEALAVVRMLHCKWHVSLSDRCTRQDRMIGNLIYDYTPWEWAEFAGTPDTCALLLRLGYDPEEDMGSQLDPIEYCKAKHLNQVYSACVLLLGMRKWQRSTLLNGVPRDLVQHWVCHHLWVHRYCSKSEICVCLSMRCCRGPYNTCVARSVRAERPLDGGAWLFACPAHNECCGCGEATTWSHEACQGCASYLTRIGVCQHESGCRFIVCMPRMQYVWPTYCSGHNLCRHCGCITLWAHALCSFCDPNSHGTSVPGALIVAPAVEVGSAAVEADAGHGREDGSGGAGPC